MARSFDEAFYKVLPCTHRINAPSKRICIKRYDTPQISLQSRSEETTTDRNPNPPTP